MSTESRLRRTLDADLWPTEEALAAMLDHQSGALAAIRQALPALTQAVQRAAARLRDTSGGNPGVGRLVYAGAGASGRIAVQDGVELLPTFGWPDHRLAYLIAGGTAALVRSVEGAEDDAHAAHRDVAGLALTAADVLVSVAASGTTRYTCAAQRVARDAGTLTIGIAHNPGAPLLDGADIPVLLDTGAEFLAGSTRMLAGTAQKIALNLFSTQLMTELGRVYRGMMVRVATSNTKLVARARRVVADITGADEAAAAQAWDAAGGDIRLAVLLLDGLDRATAEQRLAAAGGDLRRARGERVSAERVPGERA